jgi:KDO2-lipid IV(A) lauroyltransferase
VLTVRKYSYRPSRRAREQAFWLESDAIASSEGNRTARIPFRAISEVHLRGLGSHRNTEIPIEAMWDLTLGTSAGQKLRLSPLHYLRFRTWEDHSAQYMEFVRQLLTEIRHHNPSVSVTKQQHWRRRYGRYFRRFMAVPAGYVALGIFGILRHFDPDRIINGAARLTQLIGPRLSGHRTARRQLASAFPKKSAKEIESILLGMWDNLGRVGAEYIFLRDLWDYKLDGPQSSRFVFEQETLDRAKRLRDLNEPVLYFGGHISNWELQSIAAETLGLNCTSLYRPVNLGPAWNLIMEVRSRLMGPLVMADPGAAKRLKHALREGRSVGMLVDQSFRGGIETMFFGRHCSVNPIIGRFARLLDCKICGFRSVRLPGNRYRIELTEPIPVPRDVHGKIDAVGTMQRITWMIESWIREHPEQWIWFYRRWR